MHTEEVECIAKGKIHKRYEFGNKVTLVTTSKNNWLVSAQSLVGNPYDGYTLANALEQVKEAIQIKPAYAYCNQGYRGHGIEGATTITICGKIPKQASYATRKWIKCRVSLSQ